MIHNSDGISNKLFHLLWQKDEIKKKESSCVNIPDTVIFKKHQPTFWYFTSAVGNIMRKKNKNVTIESIYSSFTKRASPSGIVAYFIYNLDEKGEPCDETSLFLEGASRFRSSSNIVYMDSDKLRNLSIIRR